MLHKPHHVAANTPIAFNNYLGGLGVQIQPGHPHGQNQQLMAAYALQQQQVSQKSLK